MVGGVHAIYSAKGIRRRKEKRGTIIDSCVEWRQAKKQKKKSRVAVRSRHSQYPNRASGGDAIACRKIHARNISVVTSGKRTA